MKSPASVMTVEDEREIAAVLVRYATGIDRRDWALFRMCFADTISVEYGQFGAWTSGEAITASMEDMHSLVGRTPHRVSNIVISENDGGAQVRSYVDAVLMPKTPDDPVHQSCGFYHVLFMGLARGSNARSR